jgi:hypothetical protein
MLFALGAAGSMLDGLQSLFSSKSSSSTTSASPSQDATNPFDPGAGTQTTGTATTGFSAGTSGGVQISPQTMSALLDAQSQSGTTSATPTNPQDSLKDLFSQIDANGDGSVTKSEFENALGAGGTNLAAADDVFGKLDSNSDGSVSLDELKNALQGASGHHGHHHHVHAGTSSSTDTTNADGSDPNSTDPLAALQPGVPTSLADLLKPIDKSQLTAISLDASNSATSSYDMIKQALARAEQTFSNSIAGSLSVSA